MAYGPRHRIYAREYNRRWRRAAVAALGGKCQRCGFDDARALQIDHVGGDGAARRRAGERTGVAGYYKKVIADRTGAYQLLCANCNWIKREENGEL